jgi:hypothetical protein
MVRVSVRSCNKFLGRLFKIDGHKNLEKFFYTVTQNENINNLISKLSSQSLAFGVSANKTHYLLPTLGRWVGFNL